MATGAPTTTPPVADGGIRMREVSRLAAGHRTEDSLTDRIGRAFVERLLEHVATTALGPTAANPMEQVRETLGVAKDLAGLQESKEKRLLEELRTARDELDELRKELARLRRGTDGATVDLFKLILEVQDRANQRIEKILEQMRQDQKEWRDRLEERTQKSDEKDFFRTLGMEYVKGQLQRDPRQEYEREREYWEKRLSSNNVTDLERWKAQKQFELEEKKLNRELEAQERADQRRAELVASLGKIVAEISQGRTREGAGAGADLPNVPGLYRYQCAECGQEFILRQQAERVGCPYCRAELQAVTPVAG